MRIPIKRMWFCLKNNIKLTQLYAKSDAPLLYPSTLYSLLVQSIVWRLMSKNHVHLLMSCLPGMSPHQIIWRIKDGTLSYILEVFPHLRKKFRGRYFFTTVC
ncbi:MAG: hypothetical protein EBU46_03470 [Nitrosomonadaceae bacterium]|nr:hypothetical protein [Nitrosomonadaceae bacterium]